MFDVNTMKEMADKFADLYKTTGIKPEEFADTFTKMSTQMSTQMPTIKPNKNGYEIRTKVLEMAQNNVWQDYHAKWGAFEQTVTRDAETGQVVTKVAIPEVPGADAVLEAADKFYNFVNGKR